MSYIPVPSYAFHGRNMRSTETFWSNMVTSEPWPSAMCSCNAHWQHAATGLCLEKPFDCRSATLAPTPSVPQAKIGPDAELNMENGATGQHKEKKEIIN